MYNLLCRVILRILHLNNLDIVKYRHSKYIVINNKYKELRARYRYYVVNNV